MATRGYSSADVEAASGGGLKASWVRSVRSDHIYRPALDKLELLAQTLGTDVADYLALTDRTDVVLSLRQAAGPPPWAEELLTEVRAMREALERQTPPAPAPVSDDFVVAVVDGLRDALAQREAARPVAGSRKPAGDAGRRATDARPAARSR